MKISLKIWLCVLATTNLARARTRFNGFLFGYNEFIKKNKIISMYNSSVLVNTRKVNMVIIDVCLQLVKFKFLGGF